MNRHHKQTVSAEALASKVLPSAKVIPLPNAKAARRMPRGFTKTSVGRMHCPDGKSEKLFWDESCQGFGLRALESGRRSWIYQYRGKHRRTRRIALGDVSAVSLDDARKAARQHAASVAQGANPSVSRRAKRNAPRVLDIIEDYL